MKITEFRKLIREEVRKILKEAVSPKKMKQGIGLPYDGGKLAAQFIVAATKLGMKQGSYSFDAPNGDYSWDFEPMDADEGEKVIIKSGRGVGDKKGNEPSAIFILNPKMQSDPTIQSLAAKCISQYD